MQKQNEISQTFVQERVLTPLSKDIPVFKGNPLQFTTVIRTSKRCTDNKTTNDGDRLFFLDQYTEGQPKVLVRRTYGTQPGVQQSKATVATTLWKWYIWLLLRIRKRLWIGPHSSQRIRQQFALFMCSCGDTMTDTEALNNMNHTSHMQTFVSSIQAERKMEKCSLWALRAH